MKIRFTFLDKDNTCNGKFFVNLEYGLLMNDSKSKIVHFGSQKQLISHEFRVKSHAHLDIVDWDLRDVTQISRSSIATKPSLLTDSIFDRLNLNKKYRLI